jgi:uncharacterized heparinase superfamily protein
MVIPTGSDPGQGAGPKPDRKGRLFGLLSAGRFFGWEGFGPGLFAPWGLGGANIVKLVAYPRTYRPARLRLGTHRSQGEWRFGRDLMTLAPGASPFQTAAPSRAFADVLHRFGWISDIVATGQDGRDRALSLIDDWVGIFGRWNRFSWDPDRVNDRLWAWLLLGPDLIEAGHATTRAARIKTLVKQARWLHRSALPSEPMGRIRHLRTRCALAAALPNMFDAGQAELAFSQALAQAVDKDGLVTNRCASTQADLAFDLLSLEELWGRIGRPPIRGLGRTLKAMVGALRFLRYRDGGLPLFQTANAYDDTILTALFERLPGSTPGYVILGGYHSADCAGSRLMVDAGPFLPGGAASQMAIEFVDGVDRIISSAGGAHDLDSTLKSAIRKTAAHAGLVLAGRDTGPVGRTDPAAGAPTPSIKRIESPQDIRFEMSLETWREDLGLVWSRTLMLDRNGSRLCGVDMLAPPIADRRSAPLDETPYQIWFPLHPSVGVTQAEARNDASTAMPDGEICHTLALTAGSGQVWHFETNAPKIEIVASVFCGGSDGVLPTRAICLQSRFDPHKNAAHVPNRIHWQLTRPQD